MNILIKPFIVILSYFFYNTLNDQKIKMKLLMETSENLASISQILSSASRSCFFCCSYIIVACSALCLSFNSLISKVLILFAKVESSAALFAIPSPQLFEVSLQSVVYDQELFIYSVKSYRDWQF